MLSEHRYGPIAALQCEVCPSDTADVYFLRHPKTGRLICSICECTVCGALTLIHQK